MTHTHTRTHPRPKGKACVGLEPVAQLPSEAGGKKGILFEVTHFDKLYWTMNQNGGWSPLNK